MATKTKKAITTEAPNPEVFQDAGGLQTMGTAKVIDGVQFNALGLESTEDHKHVAKVWQDKCTPYLDFVKQIENEKEGKVDVLRDQSEIRLDEDLKLPGGEGFTYYGLQSLALKYAKIPITMLNYLYNLDGNAGYGDLAKYMNMELDISDAEWTNKRERESTRQFLLRTRPDKNGGTVVRMVGSDRYGIVDNHEIIDMINKGFKKLDIPQSDVEKALASHVWSDADRMNGNILLPDRMKSFPDSDYGVGIAFSNSEIGTSIVNITPFLFRAICLNGCIWGRANSAIRISKKHLGEINRDELTNRIASMMQIALSEGHNLLEQLNHSRDAKVPVELAPKIITYLTRENKLTVDQGRNWYKGFLTEQNEGTDSDSGFGIVNGLTRSARDYSGETRWSVEAVAGEILTPSLTADKSAVLDRWGKIVDRAKDLKDEDVIKSIDRLLTV